jgi:putative flippase GtrA
VPGPVTKAIAWSKTHEGKKLIRFTSVSLIATTTSQLGILLFYGVFHIWGVVGSTIAANLVATVPSYYLNRSWTWGKKGRSHVLKEIVPFWTMSVLGIAVSYFGARLAKHIVNAYNFPHAVDTLIVMLANFLSFGIFWVLKLMLFNRIFHVSELEEVEEHLEHEEELAAHGGEEISPGS